MIRPLLLIFFIVKLDLTWFIIVSMSEKVIIEPKRQRLKWKIQKKNKKILKSDIFLSDIVHFSGLS